MSTCEHCEKSTHTDTKVYFENNTIVNHNGYEFVIDNTKEYCSLTCFIADMINSVT